MPSGRAPVAFGRCQVVLISALVAVALLSGAGIFGGTSHLPVGVVAHGSLRTSNESGSALPQPSGTNPIQSYGWQNLTTPLPNNTIWASAYDPALGGVVALSDGTVAQNDGSPTLNFSCTFHSTNSTWVYAAGKWTRLPVAGPTPGLYRSLAFDSSSDTLLAFQGTGPPLSNVSSYWSWPVCDLNEYVHMGEVPPSSVYFEGLVPSQHPETWEFTGGSWSLISTGEPLNAITNIVYDPALSRVVMFTTINNVSNALDLWEFANGTWINGGQETLPSSISPSQLNFSNTEVPPNVSLLNSNYTGPLYMGLGWVLENSQLVYDPNSRQLLWEVMNTSFGIPFVLGFNGSWHVVSDRESQGTFATALTYDGATSSLIGAANLWNGHPYTRAYTQTKILYPNWNATGIFSNGSYSYLNVSPQPALIIPGYVQDLWPESITMVYDPSDGYLIMFGMAEYTGPPDSLELGSNATYFSPSTMWIFGPPSELRLSVSVTPSTICSLESVACNSAETTAEVTASVSMFLMNASASLPAPRANVVEYGPTFWDVGPELQFVPAPDIEMDWSAGFAASCSSLSGPVTPCASVPSVDRTGTGPPEYLWSWGNMSSALEAGGVWSVTFGIESNLAGNATIPVDRCASWLCGGAATGDFSSLISRAPNGTGSSPYSWPIAKVSVLDPTAPAVPPSPPPTPTPAPPPPVPPAIPPVPTPISLPVGPTPILIGSLGSAVSFVAIAAGAVAAGLTRARLSRPIAQRAMALAVRSRGSPSGSRRPVSDWDKRPYLRSTPIT